MGRYVFKLPDVGEGTAEAEIVAWHVAIGQTIEEDAPLVDVMTDKATVEMTSPVAGKVIEINGAPGDMAPVGSGIVVLEVEGAGNAAEAPAAQTPERPAEAREAVGLPFPTIGEGPGVGVSAPPPPRKVPEAKPQPAVQPPRSRPLPLWGGEAKFPNRLEGEKPVASPAVRRRAEDLGVKLNFVPGSGPAGRIEHADLDAFVASNGQNQTAAARSPSVAGGSSYAERTAIEEIKVIGLRRKIAEKMQDAKRRIPHFAYVEEVDMTELETLRVHLIEWDLPREGCCRRKLAGSR
jgi:2-oxoisovalerate dehydrogenase E2 component (dihydrolipoyl transacylase)